MHNREIVFVRIRSINLGTKEMFDRDYWLDKALLSSEDQQRIKVLQDKSRITGTEFNQVKQLFTQGNFPHFESNEIQSFGGFSVEDYFEDDSGNGHDLVGLMKIATGQENPIILGEPGSVLRLGPSDIVRKELWDVETANTIAHYLQIVEVIGQGTWLDTELQFTLPGQSGKVPNFQCPSLSHVYSVLLPIRQLYGDDQTFNKTIKLYLNHVQDDRKRWWIEETKKSFNSFLRSKQGHFAIDNYTVQQLLDLVLYGAGLVHYSRTPIETRVHFKEAIRKHSRERVIFVFLSNCRLLFNYAVQTYQVIAQDFHSWTTLRQCCKPDLLFVDSLFASRTQETDDYNQKNPLERPAKATFKH